MVMACKMKVKNFEIEYVIANPFDQLGVEVNEEDPGFKELKSIVERFSLGGQDDQSGAKDDDLNEEEKKDEQPKKEKLSKKKKKMMRRLPIAVLKQLVEKPELVEIHDCSAADPFLLLHLKSYRNSVPVPRHWSQKRKYLQGKRGIEKPPFDPPTFIKETGIMELRGIIIEKDTDKKLKQKMRERLNPTMGKIDIDYQTLHDAFFVKQTKPKLTTHGDLYYEGKEYEVEMKEKRPGYISKELREALGMPEGAPPPWLVNMQRFGPPPAYPKLKIPGLNAPHPPNGEYYYGFKTDTRSGVSIGHWGEVVEEEEEILPEIAQEESEGDDSDDNAPMDTESKDEDDVSGIETPVWVQKWK